MTWTTNHRMKRNHDGPSFADAVHRYLKINPKTLTPLGKAMRFSIQRNIQSLAPIARLLFVVCPAAISWLIVAVIVNSVERVRWTWASSNVSQKIRERLAPSITNSDAPSSIISPVPCSSVVASLAHTLPNVVFAGLLANPVLGASVLNFRVGNQPRHLASTTFDSPTHEMFSLSDVRLPAFASAYPLAVWANGAINNGEPTKLLSNECFGYDSRGHDDLQTGRCVKGQREASTSRWPAYYIQTTTQHKQSAFVRSAHDPRTLAIVRDAVAEALR